MRYYKIISDNYIVSIGTGAGGEEITEMEYAELTAKISARPAPPEGYEYRLKADTLRWTKHAKEVILPANVEVTAEEVVTELEAIL